MLRQVLEARYNFELDRRQQLAEAHSLPVGALCALGAGVVVMIRTFSWPNDACAWLFAGFVAIAALAAVLATFFLALSFRGQDYMFLPAAKELHDYYDKLRVHHSEGSLASGRESPKSDRAFREVFLGRLVEAADYNCVKNDRRSRQLVIANGFLIAVLACSLVAAIPFCLDYLGHR